MELRRGFQEWMFWRHWQCWEHKKQGGDKKNKKQTNINTHGKLKPFEKIDDCSLCGYWWNCCPSLLQLSFLNLSKDLR
jgi:hypothetical protein